MSQTWTVVTATADAELADTVGAFLMEQGAPGLVTEDVPAGVHITAHFKGHYSRAAIEGFCAQLITWFPGSRPVQLQWETTTEQDWADNWKAHFPPLEIGERLLVRPPWLVEVPPSRIPVVIDPGMAFGTGHHASTRGCLTFLERCVRANGSQRVLDIGTGSGVLAIAAAKLGAGEIWAIDIDPDACAIAAANAEANGVSGHMHVRPDFADVAGVFDVVVANLFAVQLIDMAALIHNRLISGGTAIGAGILAAESDAVVRAWKTAGLITAEQLEESGWMTIMARRQ